MGSRRQWLGVALALALCTGAAVSGGAVAQSTVPAVAISPRDGCSAEVEPNDRPEQAPELTGDLCFTGELVEKPDQDLWLWEVRPEDGLATWTFTISGVEHATTSVHVIPITSPPGTFPLTTTGEVARADTSDTSDELGIVADVQLPPGRYVLGVSRADPVAGRSLTDDRDYWFSVERRLELPAAADAEPNDDPRTASQAAGVFELSGDLGGSIDQYRWTIAPEDGVRSFRLEARTSLRAPLQLELRALDGTRLDGGLLGLDGVSIIHDLRLPAGDYVVVLGPAAATAQPYTLRSLAVDDPLADPEPNDMRGQAIPIDPVTLTARGRLSPDQDRDVWSFLVDEALAATQVDIELRSDAQGHTLCLQGESGPPLTCRSAFDHIAIQGLRLPVGGYTLEVSGGPNMDMGYELRIVDLGPPGPDQEVEPNDRPDAATTWDPVLEMHGRLDASDVDHHRAAITGEPQLWSVTVEGTGIDSITWVAPDGSVLGTARAPERTAATLSDLYLLPGLHTVSVRGSDGAYVLRLSPQGGPDPNGEREPNDDLTRAELVAVEGHRTGRQTDVGDIDIYRFSLAAEEHVVVRLEPPADGASSVEVLAGETRIALLLDPLPGVPVVYDARLLPGDYVVWLRTVTPSEGTYRLSVSRADPFVVPADLEPNDTSQAARPMPASLVAEGAGWGTRGEDDWYALPPVAAAEPLVISVEGAVTGVGLSDGIRDLRVVPDGTGAGYGSEPLATGGSYALRVSSTGSYRVSVSGAGLTATGLPGPIPASLTVTPESSEVAAWWPDAQRVRASLEVVNEGTSDLALTFDHATSHAAWSVEVPDESMQVPVGGTANVPIAIVAPPDAWADVPVRVTLRALDGSGASATVATTIGVARWAEAVEPVRMAPLPQTLLGGLDVASTALGAVPVPSVGTPEQEALLHDGLAIAGSGLSMVQRAVPLELTVDLAGDAPVPIAGFVLNPLAGDGSIGARPRAVELLLSEDGTTWTPVLAAELSPLAQDQPFVLEKPVPARAARLRLLSSQAGSTGTISLGEWKVVAPPGVAPIPGPINIAEPLSGGHVAWMAPQPDSIASAYGILTEDPATWAPIIDVRKPVRWVVGFWNDRAAQVVELQWVDPSGSDPAARPTAVQVEVSTGSPLGPWQPLAMWELGRGSDGSVAPLVLSAPTWARFLRFTMDGPQDSTRRWEMPSTIRVLERPTDDEYRSILAEWGLSSPAGIYEVLQPSAPLGTNTDVPDAADLPEGARPVPPAEAVPGRVTRDQDVDWYAMDVPVGQDTLTVDVRNSPGGGVALSLQDAAGAPVRLYGGGRDDPYRSTWSARVSPGTYRLKVEQPLLSSAFAFDTSGSMSEFVPYVREALRSVARGVSRGDEAMKLYPFGEKPLNDWSDDAYLLEQAAATAIVVGDSSDAEATMLPATKELGARFGTRAMLVLTDAETTSWFLNSELWDALASVRPIIFTTHIGGSGNPALTTHLMQDWAISSGGRYQYAASQSDIDRAFDRMVTTLRRPADYELIWRAEAIVPPQATIRVTTPLDPSGVPIGPPLGRGVGVELILDTSGSMLKPLGNVTRIQVAKRVLAQLIDRTIPAGIPVALRTFKAKAKSCDSQLLVPFEPLDRARMTSIIEGLRIIKSVKTPLGATLRAVGQDLARDTEGPKVVVLVTDGEETCAGDPKAEVQALVDAGLEVTVNIVGFALEDPALKAAMEEWAGIGGGVFFDAQDETGLLEGVAVALQAPFRVSDESGTVVARGRVGGPIVRVPGYGVYRVEVLTDPPAVYEDVALGPGDAVEFLVQGGPPPPE